MTSRDIALTIETEYKNKQRRAQIEKTKRRNELYKNHRELEKLDDEINRLYLVMLKDKLNQDDSKKKEIEKNINLLRLKKQDYIAKNNIDVLMLEERYECNICKDTGVIYKDGKSQKCQCYINRYNTLAYENTNMIALTKDNNFSKFNLEIFDGEKLYGKYTQREFMKKMRDKSLSFVDRVDDKNEKSMIFYGPTGLGKTYMCLCIAEAVMRKKKNVVYESATVLFDTISKYVFSSEKSGSPSEVFYSIVKSCDLLIIDDLGIEMTNNFVKQELFEIVNKRIITDKKTIISTNLSQNELQERYEQRIYSRFVSNYNSYKFVGRDLRIFS